MKKLLCILVFIVIAFPLSIGAKAINTSFKTVDISSKKQQERVARLNLQNAEKEVMSESIKNFDINKNYVAVCVSEPQAINIYSSTGEWVCSFTFQVNYGDYWVELSGNNVQEFNLYTVRDGDLFCFDFFGKFVEAAEVDTSSIESIDTSSYLHLEKEKSNEHGTYELSSKLGKGQIKLTDEESILTLTDMQGKQTVIYDVNSKMVENNKHIKQTRFLIFIPVVVFAVISMVVSILLYLRIKINNT